MVNPDKPAQMTAQFDDESNFPDDDITADDDGVSVGDGRVPGVDTDVDDDDDSSDTRLTGGDGKLNWVG